MSDRAGQIVLAVDSAGPAVSVCGTGSPANSSDPASRLRALPAVRRRLARRVLASARRTAGQLCAAHRRSANRVAETRYRIRRVEVPGILRQARQSRGSPDRPTTRGEAPHGISAAGTPGCRKARMSEFGLIEFERRQGREVEHRLGLGAVAAASPVGGTLRRRLFGAGAPASPQARLDASCLRRDQRVEKVFGSLIRRVLLAAAARAAPALPDRRDRACA